MAQLKDLIVNGSSTLVGNVSVSTINGVTVGESPEFTDTDTSVTSSANHYTPETASGQDKTASASGATAAWSIDVVQGVTLNTDGKGHVTGVSVTSGKIPAKPEYTLDEVTNGSTRVLIPFNVIGNYTTAGKNYTIFASVSSSSTSRYKDCIVLVSGGGYYYGGGLTGQWLVEMRSSTAGAPSMKVIQLLAPSTTSTVTFGYYTVNNVTYFGMYSSSRRGAIGITSLLNNGGNLFTLYNDTTKPAIVTAAPEGWTAATINKVGLDVPSWAMAADKPAYTASEVGALAGSISRVAVTANLTNVDPAASLASGSQMHVIYYNNGSADYTISVATTYVSPDGNQINLTCPQGGYCELNVMNIDGVKYARGI